MNQTRRLEVAAVVTRFAAAVAFALFFALLMAANASSIPRRTLDTATIQRWCTAQSGSQPTVGVQCELPVRILTGSSLTDGGTKQTSDGGQPIIPTDDAKSERVVFPGDTLTIKLAPGEKCIGALSVGAVANNCTFFDVTP